MAENIEKTWYQAGLRSLEFVPDDAEFAVFGAGRTVCQALKAFYDQGFRQSVVCGSEGTKRFALDLGIDVAEMDVLKPDAYVYIDGADQIDPYKNLIKGGYKGTGDPGIEGCMYQEKQLAYASSQFIVIADDTKLVGRLGQDGYRLPVEVAQRKVGDVFELLRRFDLPSDLRKRPDGEHFVTENRNYILDADLSRNDIPLDRLEETIQSYDGIWSTGIFAKRRPDAVIIAAEDGVYQM